MAANQATVKDILVAAREVVDAAGLPKELQVVAFEKAVELLAGSVPVSAAPGAPAAPAAPPASGDTKTLDAVAAKFKLPGDTIGEVFHLDGDALALSLAPSKFESSKKGATKQIALLLSTGRQAGSWDTEWTDGSTIRKVVEDYGKYDSPNFAYTVKGMSEVFGFSGSGQSWKVKVNRKGYEVAAALVTELTGGDGK